MPAKSEAEIVNSELSFLQDKLERLEKRVVRPTTALLRLLVYVALTCLPRVRFVVVLDWPTTRVASGHRARHLQSLPADAQRQSLSAPASQTRTRSVTAKLPS